jgi:hypothetical protein
VRAGRGVAVAGCSWHRWIEEISAVRMVVVGAWQWQYWPSNGRLKKKGRENVKKMEVSHCGSTKTPAVWRGVAVAGCSWHRWIEEIGAVRMV